MQFPPRLIPPLTMFACSLAVSACGPGVVLKPLSPPSADLKAITEPKPVPSDDIVTSAQAAAAYDIAIEGWGDRLSAAGGRLCRWVKANAGDVPFDCPAPR
ncbi:MAG: hypothetical protein JWR85_3601 [Marmoricola sp.]|nr:hypothetical protein [Marmoricola sp.]